MDKNKCNFDRQYYPVVVVGAGIAGITAAYFLARAGIRVLLLERGSYPGSKNVSGGAVYSLPTRELFPEFWQEAPWERILTDQQYWMMTPTSAVRLGFASDDLANPPYNKFSIMRAAFDRWFAAKAVDAGACLWNECKADRLITEGRRVVGVEVSGSRRGVVYAGIVILAQGVNPLLAEKSGLIQKARAANNSLYVKEIIALPEEVINERFNLEGKRGTVIGLLGDATAGLIGTGSIYTFREHLGINIGVGVKTLAGKKVNAGELISRLREHPVIRPLIKGGTIVEYLAHMIPEGGFNAMPPLVFDGMMIAGDAGGLVNGTHGLNLAMYSGKYAADTAAEALEKGDVSSKALKKYRVRLERSWVLKDMRDNRKIPGWFQKNPTLAADYVGLLNRVSMEVAMVFPVPRQEKRRFIRRGILASRPVGKLVGDLMNLVRVSK